MVASAVGGADTVYLACGINTLYWRVFSTPDVKTVADLKGKKIGVTTIGSQEDSVVRFILRDRGLIPDRDFAMVAVGGAPTRLAALSKGVISRLHVHPATRYRRREAWPPRAHRHEQARSLQPGSCFASTKTYIKIPSRHRHAGDEDLCRRAALLQRQSRICFESHRRLRPESRPQRASIRLTTSSRASRIGFRTST